MGVIKTINLRDEIYLKLMRESERQSRKISQLINHHLQEYYKKKEEEEMVRCKKCGAMYSKKLGACPQCGAENE